MNRPEFVYVSFIATTPQRLYDALTQGDFTRKYWYDRRVESDWQTGSPVRFFAGGTDEITDEGAVLENDPPRLLSYSFRPVGYADYTRVTFTLEDQGGVVKLTLIHENIPTAELEEDFRQGWSHILSSLKTFLETGKALPMELPEEERPSGG